MQLKFKCISTHFFFEKIEQVIGFTMVTFYFVINLKKTL